MQNSKRSRLVPFCLGGDTGRVWGVVGPSEVSTPKSIRVVKKKKLLIPVSNYQGDVG